MKLKPIAVLIGAATMLSAPADAQTEASDSTSHRTPTPSGLMVLPAEIELGEVPGDQVADGTAWLVNTSRQPLTVVDARAGCGCTTFESFESVTLEPGEVHEVSFAVRPPDEDAAASKRIALRFRTDWGDPAIGHASITRADTNGSAIRASYEPSDAPCEPDLTFLAANHDLGAVVSQEPVDTSVWLLNHGAAPMHLSAIAAGCGCTKLIGFEPTTVPPGAATRVRLRITPDAKDKSTPHAKTVSVTAKVDGEEPLRVQIAMEIQPAPVASGLDVARTDSVADHANRSE